MSLIGRIRNRARRDMCRYFARRPFRIALERPVISFTFDDFPHSAWTNGGRILQQYSVFGTFYTALELMDRQLDAGPGFQAADLTELLAAGHELGCHTYAHCPSWETLPADFEKSIVANREALHKLLPGTSFRSLSWPINSPRPDTKRRAARYFDACRGGGQGFNSGVVDLNFLNSFFIEQSISHPSQTKDTPAQNANLLAQISDTPARKENLPTQISDIIRRSVSANGWLIFSTHDVSSTPTRLGCTPELFSEIVRCAVESGAEVLTVGRALDKIGVTKSAANAESLRAKEMPVAAQSFKA